MHSDHTTPSLVKKLTLRESGHGDDDILRTQMQNWPEGSAGVGWSRLTTHTLLPQIQLTRTPTDVSSSVLHLFLHTNEPFVLLYDCCVT